MMNFAMMAKYPFLRDTKTYIKNQGPTIEELLEDPIYERARSISIERLENALSNRDVGDRSLATESDCIMEILSYPLARMIAVCVNENYFKKRYALGEAYHFYKNFLGEPTQFLLEISKELGINAEKNENRNYLKIHFKDYLKNAPTRYKEWKIVNRDLKSGYTEISHKDLARLLLESLRMRINLDLDSRECNKKVNVVFSEDIKKFQNIVNLHKKKIEVAPVGKISIEKLPPCLKNILAAIQAGENVPHMGRFALVAFLSSLKLNTNQIMKIFSSAPDFEEDKTRYQVEHITGESSSTSYKSPACDKMRTYGICPSDQIDEICRKVSHPLSYYNKKWRQEKNR